MRQLRCCALLLCWALMMGTAQARYDQVEFFHLIERNDAGSTRKALAEGEFNANTFNHEGFSALYLALREPAPAVADVLIEDPRTKLNLENAWGENALMMAALRGLLPQAIRMMELGAEVNKKGWAPLHYAASSGHLPMIKLLLDNYAYIDAQSPTGETPLMMAAARGTPAAVQMLLEAEADPHIKNKKRQTAIDMAMERGNTDNAKIIRDWLLRGGKPAPSPSPRPKPHLDSASNSSNALPIGAGSANVNNYSAAAPAPVPASTPTPTPTPTPTSTPSPEPTPEPEPIEQAAPTSTLHEVEVQAVPEPGQAAQMQPESAVKEEPAAKSEPLPPSAAPTAPPASAPVIAPVIAPVAAPDTAPVVSPETNPTPALPLAAPDKRPTDTRLYPSPKPSVADIIAAPASRALLQILSQPDPAPPAP